MKGQGTGWRGPDADEADGLGVAPECGVHPLVIALARTAEPGLKQVMGLKLGERPGGLTTTIDH